MRDDPMIAQWQFVSDSGVDMYDVKAIFFWRAR